MRNYDDIFVIEVIDPPAYLDSIYEQLQQQRAQCRIELRNGFGTIADVYSLIERLRTELFIPFDHPKNRRHRDADENDFLEWLNKFEASHDVEGRYRLVYNVNDCYANDVSGVVSLSEPNQPLVDVLKQMDIETNLVKLAQTEMDGQAESSTTTTTAPAANTGRSRRQHRAARHRHHRNAFVDDEIHPTPSLQSEWVTVTTSSVLTSGEIIDEQQLSRTAIPSMVSPTFTLDPSSATNVDTDQIKATPTLPAQETSTPDLYHHYPKLYSTPVPGLDHSKLATLSLDQIDQLLTTPVFLSPSASAGDINTPTIEPSSVLEGSVQGATTSLVVNPIGEPAIVEASGDNQTAATTSTTSTTTSTTPAGPIVPPIAVNRKPFVNKRIRKLAITAGKYWQYRIPDDTFLDMEDGDVSKLSLSFFVDGEMPSMEYWIQLNYENKYLYALPTEENIGRYRFALQAADKNGAEVTEVIEIVVKQSRTSMSYTHMFILEQVTWTSTYLERIQAISELLYRMAIQVFEEHSANTIQTEHKQEVLKNIVLLSIEDNHQYWLVFSIVVVLA